MSWRVTIHVTAKQAGNTEILFRDSLYHRGFVDGVKMTVMHKYLIDNGQHGYDEVIRALGETNGADVHVNPDGSRWWATKEPL